MGRHTRGRHRRRPPVARRLALFGLITSAVVVLVIAFSRSPSVIEDSTPQPAPPVLDVSTPTTQSHSDSPTTTKKSNKRPAQAPEKPPPKINNHPPVTHQAPRTIKPVRPPGPAARRQVVPPVTPSTSKPSFAGGLKRAIPHTQRSLPSPVITPQRIAPVKPKPSIAAPKATASQRVVSSTPLRVTTTPQRIPVPKPPTVIVTPSTPSPTIPILPNNPKCANIGLLDAPKAACNIVLAAFPQIKTVLGVGSRPDNPTSCHPRGLAIDFMVGADKALGDRIFAFVTKNRVSLGATPVILWQVPDHFDHVHVSFEPCAG